MAPSSRTSAIKACIDISTHGVIGASVGASVGEDALMGWLVVGAQECVSGGVGWNAGRHKVGTLVVDAVVGAVVGASVDLSSRTTWRPT